MNLLLFIWLFLPESNQESYKSIKRQFKAYGAPDLSLQADIKHLLNHFSDCHMLLVTFNTDLLKIPEQVIFQTVGNNFVATTLEVWNARFPKFQVNIYTKATRRYSKYLVHLYWPFRRPEVLGDSREANPTYAVYFVDFWRQMSLVYGNTPRGRYYNFLGTLEYAVISMKSVYRICLSCSPRYLRISELATYKLDPGRRMQQIQVNLMHHFIQSDLSKQERIEVSKTCDIIVKVKQSEMSPTVEKCIIATLARKMNFTYSYYPREYFEYTNQGIKRRQALTETYLSNLRRANRIVIEFAFIPDPWGFVVIKNRLHGYSKLVTEMLDLTLWTSLFLIFTSMRLSLSISMLVIEKQSQQIFKNVLKMLTKRGLYKKSKKYE